MQIQNSLNCGQSLKLRKQMVIGFTSFGYFYGTRTLELAVSENLPFSLLRPGSHCECVLLWRGRS